MTKNFLTVALNACIFAGLLFSGLFAQAQNPVNGKIDVVRNGNNALVLKLSIQATSKNLGSSTIIFSYNHNVLSLSEDPRPASTINVENGDYYYYPAFLNNSDYTQKDVSRDIKSKGDPGEKRYTLANIAYNLFTTGTEVSIDSWTEVANIKFAIIGSCSADIDFLLNTGEMYLTDAGTSSPFDLDPANFTVPAINVTYLTPELSLTSSGIGTVANPFLVKLKSTDTNQKPAGTTGFYIYYNDQEVTYISSTDKLNTGGFGWNNASVTEEIIDDVSKGEELYNRRLVYTNNDGIQGNDNWPASNALSAETVLSVLFNPNPLDEEAGFKIYLEPINEFSHKNPDEDYIYPFIIPIPFRNVGVNDPLPVSLLSFTADVTEKKEVQLNWATSSEKDNDRFEIERSSNGTEYITLLMQKGNGTTTEFHSYSATDTKPLAGISYYRLKQIDTDGTTSYSKAVAINLSGPGRDIVINSVYPNPAQGEASLNFTLASDNKVRLQVNNILGQAVKVQEIAGKAGRNEENLTGLEKFPAGVYFINLQNGNQHATYKLVKE